MPEPRVALIVPSLAGAAPALADDARRQSRVPDEIVVVAGVRPNGRARNEGVRRSQAALLVFVDDDARLGDERLIERLIAPLADPAIGVTGSAKLLPPDAPPFQRRVAREVPRIEHAVVEAALETNPPLSGPGLSEVTTTCAAMRREVWERAGGFDETLVRSVDPEFFRRVRRLGYRFVLVPHAWVWHPAPASLGALLRKHFLYGVGHAQEVRKDAALGGAFRLGTPLHALVYLALRTLWVIPSVFVAWSLSVTGSRPRPAFRPLGALASYAAGLGYVWGWYARPPRE
jgi:GT2 family glycosyltransferase